MKQLSILLLLLTTAQFSISQSIDHGLKDCLEGKYVFTDENTYPSKIKFVEA